MTTHIDERMTSSFHCVPGTPLDGQHCQNGEVLMVLLQEMQSRSKPKQTEACFLLLAAFHLPGCQLEGRVGPFDWSTVSSLLCPEACHL